MQTLELIDTHTGGEPTRVLLSGGPDLGAGDLVSRRDRFRREFDHFRSALVNEPRGSDVMVGALIVPPHAADCAAGVIFFNNVGYLGMCGHGTIGVAVALGYAGRLASGRHRFDTPVGPVTVEYDGLNAVSIENVPSWRSQAAIEVQVPGIGPVRGDVAWGGNWFFLVDAASISHCPQIDLSQVEHLTELTWAIRQSLQSAGITGEQGAEIDHIELFGPPGRTEHDSRNFVLCPGRAYDRSPCGTGTSAKLACLAAAGKLQPGEIWRQESILGSLFEASYQWADEQQTRIIPRIQGTAFVNARTTVCIDPADPFAWGIRS